MGSIDKIYMDEALKEAGRAFKHEEVPVGAIMVYNRKIISRSHNQIKLLKDPTAHAEMIALTQAAGYLRNERLNDCTMYVTVEPCAMCAGALILARVKRLVYAAPDPKTGACGSVFNLTNSKKLNHRIKVTKGVMAEESSQLLKEFFKRKRKGKILC